ncbi:MAG: membrane dipeptidase [Bacteroidota bacterium]
MIDRHANASQQPDGSEYSIGFILSSHKTHRWLGLLLALSLSASHILFANGPTLLGTVRDRHWNSPVALASIQVFNRNGALLGITSANAQGQWQMTIPSTGVDDRKQVPQTFTLGQNYPNPFNPSTMIPFTVGTAGSVRITVHNILGQLLDAREYFLSPGTYSVDWRTKGSTGVLFYSIEMNGARLSRKMVQLDGGGSDGLGNIFLRSPLTATSLDKGHAVDSCYVVASSLIHEADTLWVPLVDSARGDFLLESIHDRAFVIDLHNDVMEVISGTNFVYQIADRHTVAKNGDPQSDIPRFRDGGVDAQVFSIWINPTTYAGAYYSTAMKFLDTLKAQAARNGADMRLEVEPDSVEFLTRQKKITGLVVVEGGHCIEDNLDKLRSFYQAGARIMTITWNNSTSWAVSAQDARATTVGLSDFGKQVIRTMDSLGMIIDVSHVGRKTVEDILATSANPIIASHSGAYTLRNHYRNLTDSQIQAIAQRGGVIGVVFYPPFLVTSGAATMESVLQHIDYIKNLVGVDYVALGSDFDGIEVTPTGLEDVTHFPKITEALLQRGYSRQDVRKILGENFMRVFKAVCK